MQFSCIFSSMLAKLLNGYLYQYDIKERKNKVFTAKLGIKTVVLS